MSSPIDVSFRPGDIARVKTMVGKFQGKNLDDRLSAGTLQAARLLAPVIRADSPVAPEGTPGRGDLAGSVVARLERGHSITGSKSFEAVVGPAGRKGAHRHLVIRGHRIVTPGGRDTGRRTEPNPYVDKAAESHSQEAFRTISAELFRR